MYNLREEWQTVTQGKGFLSYMLYLGSYEKQRVGRKGGRTQRRVNGTPNEILNGRAPWVNCQDLIVQSENYCYSSFRVASMDENKTHRKIIMTHTQI